MDGSGQESLSALIAKVDQLGEVCARLGQENAELRAQVSRLSAGPARTAQAAVQAPGALGVARPAPAGPSRAAPGATDGAGARMISRRKMGKALGAVAATAVGAAALVETAQPAAASNGSTVTAGNVTTGENRTSVLYDGAANFQGVVLLGNDSTYSGTGANFPAGVGGWAGAGSTAGAGGVQNGVYGYTDNGTGNGIVGYNSGFTAGSGAGVLGLAFTATNIAVQGTNTDGTGVSGSSGSGIGVDASGPTAVNATSTGATGVAVAAASASSTTAVLATNTGTGAAVRATNTGPGACVQATSTNGRGGTFAGKAAQVQLIPGTGATHPTAGKAGDLYVDKTSRLWFCKTGGNPATWVKIV